MQQKKIVIAGDRVYMKFFNLDYFHQKAKEANARLVPYEDFDEEKFKREITDTDAVIVIDRPLRKDHFHVMTGCKIILALEVGFDFIDVTAATEKGIIVSNVPTYGTEQVAVHALSLILACQRQLKACMAETSAGGWDYNICNPLWEIKGKKLGLIGMGRIGRSLVMKVRGLDLELIAYDPYLSDDIYQMLGVSRCYDLENLLEEADILSLHVPLSGETRHLIGRKEIARMKKTAILINTCRGKVIDTRALVEALNNG